MALLRDWLSLVRPEFPLMTLIGVAGGAAVATKQLNFAYLLAGAGPALITAASFALNDFFDVPSDKALGRVDRPIASGAIKPWQAFAASNALFAAGLALCFLINGFLAFSIAFAYSVLSFAYSAVLKRTLFVGSVAVASTYAIPFVYGNAVASGSLNNLHPFVLAFAAIAFLAGLARESFNSVKDKQGDRKLRVLSLPMLVGDKPVIVFGALLLIAAIVLSAIPLLDAFRAPYALLVGACDLLLLQSAYSALNDAGYANLDRIRKQTIYALALGLIGFATLALA